MMNRPDPDEIPIEGTLISSSDVKSTEEGVKPQKIQGFPSSSSQNQGFPRSSFQFNFSTTPTKIALKGCRPLLGCLIFLMIILIGFTTGFIWIVKSAYQFITQIFQ